jgi:hypothetical protein
MKSKFSLFALIGTGIGCLLAGFVLVPKLIAKFKKKTTV